MAAKKSASAKSSKSPSRSASRRPARTPAGEQIVTIDRRRQSRHSDATDEAPATDAPPVALERRQKVQRRRQIDPTTCERDYSVEEVEFMNAMDEYKRKSGRMFPTCSEVLEVVRGLGYVKLSSSERSMLGLDKTPDPEQTLDAASEAVEELLDETL